MSTILTLIALAIILLFFEIALPGGILAIVAVALIAVASYLAFQDYGALAGIGVFLGAGVLCLVAFFLEIKLLRNTRIGRIFEHRGSVTANTGAKDYNTIEGQSGLTLTTLAPTGTVRVGERSYPAHSLDGYLSKGTFVTVVKADAFQIKVKKQQTS